MSDEYVEGCDAFVHELFNHAGMFCPCLPDAVVDEWFRWLRQFEVPVREEQGPGPQANVVSQTDADHPETAQRGSQPPQSLSQHDRGDSL